MNTIIGFFVGLFQLLIFIVVVLGIVAFFGYNKLRAFAESIKEAWSNIGVAGRKQASLINQLIDVVKGYQESEKLVMLKVSEDMSNTSNVAQMYQQSGMVLSSVNGLAEKFPELKADQQYKRLIDSIQSCESQLEEARARYNRTVKEYNTARSSIPTVFYAPVLGFKAAPYLEFDADNQVMDMGTLKSFSADDDGARLNALLGQAGSKLIQVSNKTIEVGKLAAQKAVEGSKTLADKTQEKMEEFQANRERKQDGSDAPAAAPAFCASCGSEATSSAMFCAKCGTKIAA